MIDVVTIYKNLLATIMSEPLSKTLPSVFQLTQALGNKEFENWIRLEMDGYFNTNPALNDNTVVPPYRTVCGQYTDELGRPFIIKDPGLQFINENCLRNGVAELEKMERCNEVLSIRDICAANLIREHLKVEISKFTFNPIAVSGVLSGIKTRLLDWLQAIQPNIDEIEELALHPQRMNSPRGSYIAQHFLAVEEADELVAESKKSQNRNIFLLYSYTARSLEFAVNLVTMTRSKELLPSDQFVAQEVRLSEYNKRLKDYPHLSNFLEDWPQNPGITFAWLSGRSALEVAIKFANMIYVAVIYARNEVASAGKTSYDNLSVAPTPDPAFDKWRDRTINELLTRTIPKPDVWPSMADIHREYQSLAYKLQDEYKRAINVEDQNSKEAEVPRRKLIKVITWFKEFILIIYEKTVKAFFDSVLGK